MTDVEARLTQVLGGWAAGSVLVGAALSAPPCTRGCGRQTAAWVLGLDSAAARALR